MIQGGFDGRPHFLPLLRATGSIGRCKGHEMGIFQHNSVMLVSVHVELLLVGGLLLEMMAYSNGGRTLMHVLVMLALKVSGP